jgi:hypothetical protein
MGWKAAQGRRRSVWTTVDHALMRGLDTAFPIVRPGLSLSWNGHRWSIGHQAQRRELPTVLRLRPCTAEERLNFVWRVVERDPPFLPYIR